MNTRFNTILLLSTGCLPAAVSAGPLTDRSVNMPAVLTFLLFISATLVITWWAARHTRSRRDFYAAGNRIGGIQNGFAIAGDYMSAASFLGLVGLAMIGGYDMLYYVIALVLSWGVVLFFIAERLRNLGTYTFADAVSTRLSPKPVRLLSACGTLAVAIPYLIAQMVAAGTLVETLFGMSYLQGVVTVGVLMTIYVSFGGMIATTWVQIVKAVLLLSGGAILAIWILAEFNFNIGSLASAAVDIHPRGEDIMRPGILYTDIITVLSITLAFIGGTAGLPHVLMRFFTVRDAIQARRSAVVALSLIACFQVAVIIIGFGAIVFLVDHETLSLGGTSLLGGSNMAAIHLSGLIGGDLFLGFISAVAFATILAVVSGLTLSAAATVSHDLFANVIRQGTCTEKEELFMSRLTTILLGITGILLALLFEGQNVAVLATLPLAIAASINFPVLLLAMYWRGFTTRGAIVGGYSGLIIALVLVILGPNVWVQALGFEQPIFPYDYPTLFSMSACFAIAWLFSVTDRSTRAGQERDAFAAQLLKSQMGSAS
jgi:cation/acetate symporter